MQISTNIKYLMYALLLYLPTIANIRAELFLLAIAVVIIGERKSLLVELKEFKATPFATKYIFTTWLIGAIILASLINKFVNGDDILCLRDYYSSFYLFPLLILVSKFFGKVEVFKFLLVFTTIEVGVGCVEYLIESRSLILDLGEMNPITDKLLLYNSRCYGLSSNSSIFGYKILVGVILLEFTRFSKVVSWFLRGGLLIGALLSFSRAVVVVLILFWVVRAFYGLIKGYKERRVYYTVAFQFNMLMLVLIVVFNSGIRDQISRGGHDAESVFGEASYIDKLEPSSCDEIHAIDYSQGQIDPELHGWGEKLMMRTEGVQTSGRKLIWVNYLNFIENNLMFGKGSNKLMLRSWQNESGKYKLIHAHNSFLMMLAGNGLIITALYFLFYLANFKSRNFLAIAAILLYSLLNYGIFWGFSYMDVIFIILLTLKFKDSYDYQGES